MSNKLPIPEQHLYMACEQLYKDVQRFVTEEIKVFGLKKHKRMKKNLSRRVSMLEEYFDSADAVVNYDLADGGYFPAFAYEDFFFAAGDVIDDVYELAVRDSKIFKTIKRKEASNEAFMWACDSQRVFRQAFRELQKHRAINLHLK